MQWMAAGDIDAGRTLQHRNDGIGAMMQTIAVLRDASADERDNVARQDETVVVIDGALDHGATGDLSYLMAEQLTEK